MCENKLWLSLLSLAVAALAGWLAADTFPPPHYDDLSFAPYLLAFFTAVIIAALKG